MSITLQKDNDVIVYALEKIMLHARRTQQIFVAECIWWLASIIGLAEELVLHIDKLHGRRVVKAPVWSRTDSIAPKESKPIPEEPIKERQDKVLKECEEYLKESRRLRDIVALKSKRTTKSGRINPTLISKKLLRQKDRPKRKKIVPADNRHKTTGIDEAEIQRRKGEGECLRCTWPADRKEAHRVQDCISPIKLDKGTASYPKGKEYLKLQVLHQQQEIAEASYEESSSEKSSNDSL
jgi:hypothetical protein